MLKDAFSLRFFSLSLSLMSIMVLAYLLARHLGESFSITLLVYLDIRISRILGTSYHDDRY